MSKKGIIFSTDAIYAVVFVLVLSSAFSFYYLGAPTSSDFLKKLNYKTSDAAIIAFYLEVNPVPQEEGISGTIVGNPSYSKCTSIYDYTITQETSAPGIPDTASQSAIISKKFCMGI